MGPLHTTDLGQIISRGDVHGFERIRHRVDNHGSDDDFTTLPSNFGSASRSPAPNRPMAAAYTRPTIPHFGARPSYAPCLSL